MYGGKLVGAVEGLPGGFHGLNEGETPSINNMYIQTWQRKVIRVQFLLFLFFFLGLWFGSRKSKLW